MFSFVLFSARTGAPVPYRKSCMTRYMPRGICRPLLKRGGGGVQGAPGAVTMEVAGDSQSGWGQLLAVGGAVAGGWGASKGMRQGVV